MKKRLFIPLPYLLSITFIIVWWVIAFNSHEKTVPTKELTQTCTQPESVILSKLDRQTIRRALDGDLTTIVQLLTDWDIDARLIQDEGVLPNEQFCHAMSLARQLQQETEETSARLLPQTFVSASFLLALSPPENIIALPKAMRRHRHLYPGDKMDAISLDIDGYNTEILAKNKPDLAFIAPYSHPSTVQTLKNQGIELLSIDNISSVDEVIESLHRVGKAINENRRATLLALFIEAALNTVDNHLSAWCEAGNILPKRPLYLTRVMNFAIPTEKTLQAKLLHRLGINQPNVNDTIAWQHCIDLETIAHYTPDCLIISCSDTQAIHNLIDQSKALKHTPAVATRRVFCIDEETQNAPCQYLVLAYFDIAEALKMGGNG